MIGVQHRGIARAYPIAILNWHEVVNDRYGEEPVVVTFCPLCGTGMVFRAAVGGRPLVFGVSGLLYNSDVLLYDRQTGSLWSQLLAKAVSGPHKGQPLTQLAAEHTTWADWRKRHPDSQVLTPQTGHERDYRRDPYAGYGRSAELMFPVRFQDARLHPKEQVIGVSVGNLHKAYPFSHLSRVPTPLEDRLGTQQLRIEFDPAHRTGRVFDADGRVMPSVIAFWFAWYAFHPDTALFVPGAKASATK